MIFHNYSVVWHKVTRLVQHVEIKLTVFIYPNHSDVWVALRLSVQKLKSAGQVQIPDLAVSLTLC